MSLNRRDKNLTAGERLTARLLRWSPLVVFLALALPLPAYFLFRYFTATEGVGEYLILAMTSLAASAFFGLIAALLVFIYRRFWERRLRERLATDGVTENELSWFVSELSAEQRRALKEMEQRNPLLADAYRETLAARITARRVLERARRDAAAVENRLTSASQLQAANRAELERGLQKDRERLSRVERDAIEHFQETEARLQLIEAMANRDASQTETELALQRLGSARDNVPLGLTTVQQEQEAREEIEKELRELPPQQGR